MNTTFRTILGRMVIVVVMVCCCSCMSKLGNEALQGIYEDEQTRDTLEFMDKGRIAFTPGTDGHPGWHKGHRYEYEYYFREDGTIEIAHFRTSGEAFHFPYVTLRLSASWQEVYFTTRDGGSGVLKRRPIPDAGRQPPTVEK